MWLFVLLVACRSDLDGRCRESVASIHCDHESATLDGNRRVQWQVPEGTAPAAGWPVAILFQGSLFPSDLFWVAPTPAPLGAQHQVALTAALLREGVAVLTPEALGLGLTCWNTNLPPWSTDWSGSPDAALIEALFDGLEDGTFGPVDPGTLYAAGISSGGYMSSRMALTFPDRFAAVAVVSASYETCAGLVCSVPDGPAPDHPPTLFIHGKLDPVVPIGTMWKYHDWLEASDVPVAALVAPLGVHAWQRDAPETIVDWFSGAPR